MRRVHFLSTGLATSIVVLTGAADAWARAGGGSGGFGGGRGGRGGGGSFFFLYFLFSHPILLAIVALGIGVLALLGWVQSVRYQARRRERVRQVELAAAEASDDDAAFGVDVVVEQAARLFTDIQSAWDGRDRTRLADLVGVDLMAEWTRRLDDFDRRGWHNRVAVLSGPRVEYVGLVNREDDADDRAVVLVEAGLRDIVEDRHGRRIMRSDAESEARRVAEYWTLGKRERDGRWMLLSVEQRSEGDHQLSEPVVATPWADTARLRDQSLVEGAVADQPPGGTKVSEIASIGYEGDARAEALDLSLADARFAFDVLEVAVRRALAAWAEAVDGSDRDLAALTSPEALRDLLHPDAREDTRVVVRAPRVHSVTIEELDASAEPARMTVAVEVEALRYIEDRDTTEVLAGSQSRRTRFTERWAFGLDGSAADPWRIVDAAAGRDAGPARLGVPPG